MQAASSSSHMAIVQLLLEKGADVNAQGGYDENVVQAASSFSHMSIVQLLLERGADANTQETFYKNNESSI
jgi:ankyrin repeat protein